MQPSGAPAIPAGTLVHGRYQVTRTVGRGGMGAVYEAVDQRLGNTVALKQMLVSGASATAAFEREARLLAGLRHPALPHVTDFFADDLGQFLVMEFIPGSDLATLLSQRGQPLPVDAVLRWAEQALNALEYLHVQQPPIVHRDIKPQNIKLTPSGELIILDFGLAKGAVASQTTTTGSIFAYTPNYAPLEQVQGSGTTPLSDLYALAATLHHLLTGTPPPDVLQRLGAQVSSQPDPLPLVSRINPLVSPALAQWLVHGLALDPQQRYPSAAAMRAALQALRATSPTANVGTTVSGALPPTQVAATVRAPVAPPPTPPTMRVPGPPTPLPPGMGMAPALPPVSPAPPPGPARRGSSPPCLLLAGLAIVGLIIVGGLALVVGRQVFTQIAGEPSPTRTIGPGNTPVGPGATLVPPPITGGPPITALPMRSPVIVPPTTGSGPEPGFGPPGPQTPIAASASASAPGGVDAGGNQTSFEPEKVADGQPETAWRVPGDGQNQFVQLDFDPPVRMREIQVIPGYAKIDPYDGTDRFRQNRRVRKARLEFSNGTSYTVDFADDRNFQVVRLPQPVLSNYVRLVVLETTPLEDQNSRDFTPISELVVVGEAQLQP